MHANTNSHLNKIWVKNDLKGSSSSRYAKKPTFQQLLPTQQEEPTGHPLINPVCLHLTHTHTQMTHTDVTCWESYACC